MNCHQAQPAMLTADLDELRGLGESELANHIRGCKACSQAAQRVLLATELLATNLDSAARATRKPVRWSPQSAWFALPIAAAVAAVLVSRPPQQLPLPRVGNLEDVKRPVVQPVVNAPANRNVAVFKATEMITVVWDLGSKGGS
jgi:hypothetical protein